MARAVVGSSPTGHPLVAIKYVILPCSPNGDGNGVLIRQNLGSSPRRGFVAEVAQLVELLPSKQKVAGSSPVLRS